MLREPSTKPTHVALEILKPNEIGFSYSMTFSRNRRLLEFVAYQGKFTLSSLMLREPSTKPTRVALEICHLIVKKSFDMASLGAGLWAA